MINESIMKAAVNHSRSSARGLNDTTHFPFYGRRPIGSMNLSDESEVPLKFYKIFIPFFILKSFFLKFFNEIIVVTIIDDQMNNNLLNFTLF